MMEPDTVFRSVLEASEKSLSVAGYRRRASTFRKVASPNALIVNFQKSATTSRGEIKFTINLGVVVGQLLDREGRAVSEAIIEEAHIRQRIGTLMPGSPDAWWYLGDDTNSDALISEISGLLTHVAIPYLDSLASTEAVEDLWRSGRSPGLTSKMRDRYLLELEGGGSPRTK